MDLSTVAEIKTLPREGNTDFMGIFILKRGELRKTRAGKDFLSIELGDKTGSFRTNCWGDSLLFEDLSRIAPGAILEVFGQTDYYNDSLSPKLARLREVQPEEAEREGWMNQLVATSVEPAEVLWSELLDHIANLEDPALQQAVQLVIDDHGALFHDSPAAIAMHHAYRSGLLEHTVRMLRCAKALFPLYPIVQKDITLAGIILHDVGKILEYTQGFASGKTRAGILQGHVVLGYRIARKAAIQAGLAADQIEQLEHIILSHQGELEWGAAVKAATPEAVFVSMIDNLDAKMGMVEDALKNTPEGQEFSEYHPGLGSQVLIPDPTQD